MVVDRERDAFGVDVAGFARRLHRYRLLVARALEDVADRDHRTRERGADETAAAGPTAVGRRAHEPTMQGGPDVRPPSVPLAQAA